MRRCSAERRRPCRREASVALYTSYDLFGAKITPTKQGDLLEIVHRHIESAQQCVIASQNVHGLFVGRTEPAFVRLHSFAHTYVHIDGMPLVWLCRLRGIDAVPEHRVTLVDWIWPLLERAAKHRWRVYYLGGSDAVIDAGTRAMRERLPDLQLRGHNGFFAESDDAANAELVGDIRAYAPHLILVGMGMGRQERWILKNLMELGPATICTVGACMEYVSGAVRTPPRWMGQVGLEWLFRLAENPSRFWYRYTVEPMHVLSQVMRWLCFDSLSRESTYRSNAVTPRAVQHEAGNPTTVSARGSTGS